MSTTVLLSVEPSEIKFPLELRKRVSCTLHLINKTQNHVAFKVKTTNAEKYSVRPNMSIVFPQSTCDIVVTMQAQKELPDINCKDKFLIQSVIASHGAATPTNIISKMFKKDAGHVVEECKLKVVYVPPKAYSDSELEEAGKNVDSHDGGSELCTSGLLGIEPLELNIPVELRKHVSCTDHVSMETVNTVTFKLSTTGLLSIEPLEIKFPIEVRKQVACTLHVSNKTGNTVAFKVKTTYPKRYYVRPNLGILLPQSTCDITVMKQPQDELLDINCKDKFMIQSVIASPGTTPENITSKMFSKDAGHVEECKLRVIYHTPCTSGLLSIEPSELKFPLELYKPVSCTLHLSNKTGDSVAFKVKTTNPKKYYVSPNTGIVLPRSPCSITVIMQAQKELPADLNCKDKFLIQSVIASPCATPKEMFHEDAEYVNECKLKVVYLPPAQPPGPVAKDSSPKAYSDSKVHESPFRRFLSTLLSRCGLGKTSKSSKI